MRLEVVTAVRMQGKGKVSGNAYDILAVGCVMTTARGSEMVELMLDGEHPMPERGKQYDAEISFYPNREKKLAFRVERLRPVGEAPKAGNAGTRAS